MAALCLRPRILVTTLLAATSKNIIMDISSSLSQDTQIHYRACHLCEAICGLEITTQGDTIKSIKGDKNDPVSHGYICPKATAIADIHSDPDRIRHPMRKIDGEWHQVSWEEALDYTAEQLVASQTNHGPNSVGFFAGNPGVHNYGNMTHGALLRRAIKTRNNFSATSLDQLPHLLAALTMYGHQFAVPVPDIDRTQYFLMLGGNPLASNGSMMTVPNIVKRLKALQARDGKLIIVDPRRSETADMADQHMFIRPGSDAFLLMAIVRELFTKNLVSLGHLAELIDGVDDVRHASLPYTLELAEQQTGIKAERIAEIAQSLATVDKAVVYGRMGVSVQEFGGLCQWAIQVINLLIGAIDTEGGAILASPAFGYVKRGTPGKGHFDAFRSRVSNLPEFAGELPAVVMAEEILTPGEDQIKSMVTIAGNPLISSANTEALEEAFESLDFYVAIDFYINATTRHADVILPPTSPLEHDHYDLAFLRLAVHNSTRYNPAIYPKPEGCLDDWEIFNKLSAKISTLKGLPFSPLPEPVEVIDRGIQSDEYSEAKGSDWALTMDKIKQAPHGIDLGPLKPGLEARLANDSGRINLAPEIYLADLPRLLAKSEHSQEEGRDLLLIGRRHIRSNNSWMHNYHRLVKGKPRWQLLMNPEDLAARGLQDDDDVVITSRVGTVTTKVVSSDELMPGVISLPHGWGHTKPGIKMEIASKQEGANCNRLTDDRFYDALCGNAALNGVPVSVSKASVAA